MTEISVKNIGPVEDFRFDLNSCGLLVLKAPPGWGKSMILRTIELVMNGRTDVRPTKRDGATRGEAHVAGATLRIMKTVRCEGDLTVEGLGDLSIAALHSPKYETAATRDKHRIKILVRLADVPADPTLFHSLVGGSNTFNEIVPRAAVTTNDLLDMQGNVKAAFEKEARRYEEHEQSALADSRAQTTIADSIDSTLPSDEAELQRSLETAVATEQDAKTRRKQSDEQKMAKQRAQESLAEMGEGLTLAEAEAAVELARTGLEEKRGIAQSLAEDLVRVQADTRLATGAEAAAKEKATEARSAAEQVHSDLTESADRIRELARKIAELQAALQLAQTEQARLASLATTALERATLAAQDLAEKEQASLECMSQQADALASVRLAKSEQAGAESALAAAQAAVEQAKREGTLRAELQATIAAQAPEGPSESELTTAAEAVAAARASITTGVKVRTAKTAKLRAEEHNETARQFGIKAKRLRDAAQDTAVILTQAIARIEGCPFQVKINDDGDPRLVMATDRSSEEYVEDLSDGERWLPIIRMAAKRNRLIVLHQAALGELPESSRATLHRIARDQGCYIISAEAEDCEPHVELYSAMEASDAA